MPCVVVFRRLYCSGSDLKPMPHRFLLAENKDVTKAWARWEATLRWRKENNTDDILSKPHPRLVFCFVYYSTGQLLIAITSQAEIFGRIRKLGAAMLTYPFPKKQFSLCQYFVFVLRNVLYCTLY